jgi:hypothetical protein
VPGAPGLEADVAGGQYPQEMSARKHQHRAFDRAQPANDAVGSGGDLADRFAPRATVAEQVPVRAFRQDLGRVAALIEAIVPFGRYARYTGRKYSTRSRRASPDG